MNSNFYTGSLCLTEIIDLAKSGHSAFTKAENGKIYFNIKIWHNEEPDKFGNCMSIQLNPKKDAPESENKKYIGNAKEVKAKEPVKASSNDIEKLSENMDDLPF